jgi:hypothetical protein
MKIQIDNMTSQHGPEAAMVYAKQSLHQYRACARNSKHFSHLDVFRKHYVHAIIYLRNYIRGNL